MGSVQGGYLRPEFGYFHGKEEIRKNQKNLCAFVPLCLCGFVVLWFCGFVVCGIKIEQLQVASRRKT